MVGCCSQSLLNDAMEEKAHHEALLRHDCRQPKKICHAQEQGRAFICAQTDDCGRCHGCKADEARVAASPTAELMLPRTASLISSSSTSAAAFGSKRNSAATAVSLPLSSAPSPAFAPSFVVSPASASALVVSAASASRCSRHSRRDSSAELCAAAPPPSPLTRSSRDVPSC